MPSVGASTGGSLGGEEDTFEIDCLHLIPQFFWHGEEVVERADAGVVDENVQPAEVVDGLSDQVSDVHSVGDVSGHSDRLATSVVDLSNDLGGVCGVVMAEFGVGGGVVIDDDVGAGICEPDRDSPSDTAGGSCD